MVYQALAEIYDTIMAHVRYQDWAELIARIEGTFAPGRSLSILEIGGGTGQLGSRLAAQGYTYTGSDLSFEMCRSAHKKQMPFICANAEHLPYKTNFDMVVFLYDGINYLRELSDYAHVCKEVHRVLSDDGLFLFDITTLTNSINHFSDFVDFEDFGSHYFMRHSYYRHENHSQHNEFTIFKRSTDPTLYNRFDEHHEQRVFDPVSIADAIPKDLFEICGIWDGFTFRKYSRSSERIHFLLRKKPGRLM